MEARILRPAWAEINLDRLCHNIHSIINRLTPQVKLLAVVKADAYGHGAVPVASLAVQQGASMLGVATVGEGIELRQAGITAPVLILGAIDKTEADLVAEYVLTATVFTLPVAMALHAAGQKRHSKVKCHIRIDTGGGTLGIPAQNVPVFLSKIKYLPGLELAGVYTHLYATYGYDGSLVRRQIDQFDAIMAVIKKLVPQPLVVHAASSPGIVSWPEAYYDMVRAGNLLYGLMPEIADERGECRRMLTGQEYQTAMTAGEFLPVMQLKAKIVDVKKVLPGSLWLYGNKHQIHKESVIATVPLGYADGFPLAYLTNANVLVGGKKVAVIGKVVMDYFMVDVTGLPGVAVGDEVVIWGEQGGKTVTADEIALQAQMKMLRGERSALVDTRVTRASLCLLSNRLPRIYL